MSKNIWDVQQNVNNDINRNSFDWSHINNFTAKFGYYYPVLSQLLPANSKWDCNPYLGMQLMPLQFPVQTPMKARMSFFKVPLRILWKDYRDFVSNFRDDLEEPYHDIPVNSFDDFYGKCQLAEYNDIPNVVYGASNLFPTLKLVDGDVNPYQFGSFSVSNINVFNPFPGSTFTTDYNAIGRSQSNRFDKLQNTFQKYIKYELNDLKYTRNDYNLLLQNLPTKYEYDFSMLTPGSIYNEVELSSIKDNTDIFNFAFFIVFADSNNVAVHHQFVQFNPDHVNRKVKLYSDSPDSEIYFKGVTFELNNLASSLKVDFTSITESNLNSITSVYYIPTLFIDSSSIRNWSTEWNSNIILRSGNFLDNYVPLILGDFGPDDNLDDSLVPNYYYITPDKTPYYGSENNPDGLKLSAYRARAYECIYNSYLRDPRNNPLVINGKQVYNEWLPNYEGGADTYVYKLRRANWEKDFLTTAVRQPQQNKQPLVGLTQYVDNVDPSNPNGLGYNLALVDENGNKYKIQYVVDDSTTGLPDVTVGEILPEGQEVEPINFAHMLNATNYGISIPDFRVVNAYQKFLELNLRKGYSYKDIVEGRFDCKVRYDDLLMPEYLGGFTRDINMNRVVQSVDVNNLGGVTTEDSGYGGALGALSGDAFLSTGDVPHISCFCDEECLIIGLLSVVPTPSYTQLIPRDYYYRDLLDHFQPEFANLGYQPIPYKEVCPLQCKAFGISPEDTFGYQRSWYEYVQKPDTVHGLLRSNLRNFIMNRNFESVPRLTEDFLLVDPEQLNDVFQVTEDTDKIVGQCKFDIKVELPIPRVSIPRLD